MSPERIIADHQYGYEKYSKKTSNKYYQSFVGYLVAWTFFDGAWIWNASFSEIKARWNWRTNEIARRNACKRLVFGMILYQILSRRLSEQFMLISSTFSPTEWKTKRQNWAQSFSVLIVAHLSTHAWGWANLRLLQTSSSIFRKNLIVDQRSTVFLISTSWSTTARRLLYKRSPLMSRRVWTASE